MIACDEIIFIMDTASTKMTNTIATNVLINCHSKKVRFAFDFIPDQYKTPEICDIVVSL